jgi:prevent-host-death family protein
MAAWQVQQAKSKFSELMHEAETKGPQIITRHGDECAVVLSIKDYRALSAAMPNLRDYLLGGPKVDSFPLRRSRDKGRTITL